MLAIDIFLEIRAADGVVHERHVRVRRVVVRQMVPAVRDFADELVVAEPLELMQLKAGGGIYVFGVSARHLALLNRITLDQFSFRTWSAWRPGTWRPPWAHGGA